MNGAIGRTNLPRKAENEEGEKEYTGVRFDDEGPRGCGVRW